MFLYHIRRDIHNNDLTKGYIGISEQPERRWKEHQRSTNQHLKRALEKYNDIQMVIITKGNEDEMKRMEEYLRPRNKIGWNLVKGGGLPPVMKGKDNYWYGKKLPDHIKESISQANKGRPSPKKGKSIWSDADKKRIGDQHRGKKLKQHQLDAMRKRVAQYTLDGEFITEHESIAAAEQSLGKKSSTNIGKVCRGQLKQALGYIWKYV